MPIRAYLDDQQVRAINLIQRLEERKYGAEDRKGIDRFFSMDYMGAAEFEFGALPQALREMRESGFDKHKPVPITVKPEEVDNKRASEKAAFKAHYLGPPEWIPFVRAFFIGELADDFRHSLKERTDLPRAYGIDSWNSKDEGRIVGWWDITNHWAMFKTKKHAKQFLDGIRNKKKA